MTKRPKAIIHVWVQAWLYVNADDIDDIHSDESLRHAARENFADGSSDEIEVDDDAKIIRVEED